MLDVIITWSGWLVAIGMVIWKVVETLRNRPAIKFSIGMSEAENLLYFIVVNEGRRPMNLISAGLQYSDGCSFDFPSRLNVHLGWFYNRQPRIIRLSLKHIKDLINEIDADAPIVVKFIYVTNENGDRYRAKIASPIRDKLHT